MSSETTKTRNVLVLRHVPFEHLGYAAQVLDAEDIPYQYRDMGAEISTAEIGSSAALIVMGGPMSANDPEPWVDTELTAIRTAIDYRRPVLGICLGAQLIAKALGGKVHPNPIKEIGWSRVYWTEAGAADPLFAGLQSPETIFQWHGETFTLPPQSTLLAWTADCLNQAFRWGPNVYALQFHPEVTPDMIEDWCRQDANCGDVRELTVPIDAYAHSESQRELCHLVFTRWVRRFLKAQP
jgi:GMP synthase (glutamine-hydrolysing)